MPPLWCRLDRLWFGHPGVLEGTMTRQPFLCPLDHVFEVFKFLDMISKGMDWEFHEKKMAFQGVLGSFTEYWLFSFLFFSSSCYHCIVWSNWNLLQIKRKERKNIHLLVPLYNSTEYQLVIWIHKILNLEWASLCAWDVFISCPS